MTLCGRLLFNVCSIMVFDRCSACRNMFLLCIDSASSFISWRHLRPKKTVSLADILSDFPYIFAKLDSKNL
ncbi:hypothetical protein V1511DRAFT_501306 [Dipodascopsis uninucleata]